MSIHMNMPPPLSKEDEAYYIEMLEKADATEERNILVERNLRLVVYIVKKFSNTRIDPEDLFSIGTIGLIKAVKTFNKNKKNKIGYLCHTLYHK